jgi:hypothetical protein
MAHLYTGTQAKEDVDADFSGRIYPRHDLAIVATLEDGTEQLV